MLPIKEIENFVKEEVKDRKIISHDFGHLKRVAIGGKWFVEILGGNKEEQDMAYLTGLLHDIVRYKTEKIYHSDKSAERSKKILEIFNVDKDVIEKIVEAVKDHSAKHEWRSIVHQSSFLADKILELMGAYLIFRRYAYIGESEDFKNVSFGNSPIFHTTLRFEKYTPKNFSSKFRKLVIYQCKWLSGFFKNFENGDEWAILLAKKTYENGKIKKLSLEEFIKNFKPICEFDRRIKDEAFNYIKGKKFKDFEKLIKS